MDEETYTVEFLIRKTVKVKELDEIQAELAAVRKLTRKQREAVEKVRIVDAVGSVVFDFMAPDKDFWAEWIDD